MVGLLRYRVAFFILLTRNPAEVDLPAQTAQVSKQRFGLAGDCEVEPFPDTPSAVELIDDQVGISGDRNLPWRARTQALQDMEDADVLRRIVGHGTALTDDPCAASRGQHHLGR
jgi:hypothetical protein